MTKRNTLIIAIVVIAVAIGGFVTYAYWDQIATMVGVGSQQYDTSWIELRNGGAANGDVYQVAQNPNSEGGTNYSDAMPNPPFAPSIQSRWVNPGGDPGQIWLYLGEDAPAGEFNIELYLNYESSSVPKQAEPLLIETIAPDGSTVDSDTVEDTIDGPCSEDNTGWIKVTTDCSSGGGNPLKLNFAEGGGLRFTAPAGGGSLSVGGVRVYGMVSGADVDVNIPKSVNPSVIESTGTMNFTFNIENNGTDEASHVILYESLVDNNLDGQIDFQESTLGGASLASLAGAGPDDPIPANYCPDATPEGGYCFLDIGGTPGVPDTILGYVATLGPGSTPVNLTLKPKITLGGGGAEATGFTEGSYTNAVGITAAEINPGDSTYPPSTMEDLQQGIANWNWVNQTAQVTVGGVTPPDDPELVLDKIPASQSANAGDSSEFTVRVGNESSVPATEVFFWDTWVDNDLDMQVESVDFKLAGTTDWVSLGTPSGDTYADCGGTEELAACYLDVDSDGAGDTILLYTDPQGGLGQFALTDFFSLRYNLKSSAPDGTYKNQIGITSKELNSQDPGYPGTFGVEQWNWVLDEATLNLSGSASPGLVLDKVPESQSANAGDSSEFTVQVGNESSVPATEVFFWDTWVDNDLDMQVESVDFKLAGTTDWVSLGTPSGDTYADCGGTEELAACYLDVDSDGAGDTILLYTDPQGGLGQFALTDFFSLRYNLKSSAPDGTYKNQIGITSKELNSQDPGYPGTFGVEQWNWVLDEATLNLGGIVPPQEEAHATLAKSVSHAAGQGDKVKYEVGDTVEYSLTVTNDGNSDLTNMRIIDDFDENYLENVTVTQGTECSGVQQLGKKCFEIGTLSPDTGGVSQYPSSVTVKYTGQIKNNAAGATVGNTANCNSDQFPNTGGTGVAQICRDTASFPVESIQPQEPYDLWVKEAVDKATAKPAEKLNYTTSGGNSGDGLASGVWFVTSLVLPPTPQPVIDAISQLGPSPSLQQVQEALQQNLGVVSAASTGTHGEYINLPGDDYVTGLEILTTTQAQAKLDLDHDGICDTIIHQEDATWPAGYEDIQKPFTTVKGDLAPGDYTITSTGLVFKPSVPEVLTDDATTTVNVPGPVEPSPVIDVTKTVTDNDETNVMANTAEAGEVLTYNISYTNTEKNSTAREAWIDDDYDESYVTIVDAGGAEDSGNGLFWYLGNVAYGQTVTKTFTARIVSPTPSSGVTFDNMVTIGAMDVEEETATVTTTVPADPTPPDEQPYLTSSKNMTDLNGGAVESGDTLQYAVTITNSGNGTATEVEAIDDLPGTLTEVAIITIPDGAIDQSSGNKIYISGFSIQPGASVEIVYTAKVAAGLADGTAIPNGVVAVNDNPTPGTTPASPGPTRTGGTATSSRPGTVTGRVGSAYTGPGTGGMAAAQVAGAQTVAQAAETGGNLLVIAIITTLLAVGAGVGVVYLRKQLTVTS